MSELPGSAKNLFGHFALWAVLVVAAVMAYGFELDRESRSSKNYSSNVPEPFRHFSQAELVARALDDGDAALGLKLAKVLVQRRPIPAENLALLSVAASRAHQDKLAVAGLSLASTRGWREPISQTAVMAQAIQSGKWDVAFVRAIALWSESEQRNYTVVSLNQILSEPQGREAAADWLMNSPRWRTLFLNWAGEHLAPGATGQLLASVYKRDPSVFACSDLSTVSQRMLARGAGDAAEAAWPAACAKDLPGQFDFAFGSADSDMVGGPFAWRYGSPARLEGDGTGYAIKYEQQDPGLQVLATRFMVLPPGTYKVSIGSGAKLDYSGFTPLILFYCLGQDGTQSAEKKFELSTGGVITIAPRDCSVQVITIGSRRGHGSIGNLSIRKQDF